MSKSISIQGFEGSFHQIAAQQFFGKDIRVVPCATFREVVELTKEGRTDASVMAIENSIAGSILPNYNLLQKSNLHIIGEIYLPIRQHLLVNPGVQLEDIREVHSHPMAIQQCLDYLVPHNWKLVETEDTALSAKRIHQHKNKHAAAIAGSLAAELFELDILAENIHTEKSNYTRFLVLQRDVIAVEAPDKASISFQTDHSKGSLAKVLTRIAEGGINLSKLQSFPIPGSNWKYKFHADMEFDSLDQFRSVIEDIKPVTAEIKIFGIYKNGHSN
ncbi:MAG: prephenate dehydratase [Flavisolibacter sp.]